MRFLVSPAEHASTLAGESTHGTYANPLGRRSGQCRERGRGVGPYWAVRSELTARRT